MTLDGASPSEENRFFSHFILERFLALLGARWLREALEAILLVCIARRSSPTYGGIMLAMGLSSMVLSAVENGLNQFLIPRLTQAEGGGETLPGSVATMKAALLLLSWIALAFFVQWQDYSLELKLVVMVISIGGGLEAMAGTFFTVCQVGGHQKSEGRIRSMAAGAGFAYGLTALGLGAPAMILAFYKVVEGVAQLAGAVHVVARSFGLPVELSRLKEAWQETGRRGATFLLIAVAGMAYNKINILFLNRFGGLQAVAEYSATWQLVDGVSCLVSGLLLQSVLFPIFGRLWRVNRKDFVILARSSASWLLAASVPLMFFLYVESDRLIPLIYGPGYENAVWMQKALVWTIGTGALHNLALFLMLSMGQERRVLLFYLLVLLFNLICCVFLISHNPLDGAVAAIVLTKAGVFLLTVWVCQRSLQLIRGGVLLELGAAALCGGMVYSLVTGHMLRGFAELAGVAPTLILMCHWWRRDRFRIDGP